MSWHHGDYLALAQAIAATLAVIGAFCVVFLQHHLEGKRTKQKERQESARLIAMAASFVRETLDAIDKMATEKADELRTETGVDRVEYSMRLHQLMEALNGIPIAGLATSSAAHHLIAARGLLNDAIQKSSRDPTAGQGNDHFPCGPAYGAPYAPVTRGLRAIAAALDEELKRFS